MRCSPLSRSDGAIRTTRSCRFAVPARARRQGRVSTPTRDLLVATCEAPDAADPWIVVTVGLEHLLSLGGGYVQPACARVDLRTCFHSPGGLSARSRPAPACRQFRNRSPRPPSWRPDRPIRGP